MRDGRMNEVREDFAPYGSSFIPHNSSFSTGKPVTVQTGMVAEETAEYIAGNRDLKWKYVHGEDLVLYGKYTHDACVKNRLMNININEVNYV